MAPAPGSPPGIVPASVIVVSRNRPEALARCLAGLMQQDHPELEIVAVTDAPGRAAVARSGTGQWIKLVPFDGDNIAAARNMGLVAAAGQVVAFIDDDAVPEPSWLRRLTAPIGAGDAPAAGGFVRGRNGISFQWRAAQVDRTGRAGALASDPARTILHSPPPDRAIKTEGTNMAFERAQLLRMGGFDHAFRFFLDETDLNMRLSAAGALTAIVPRAEVHHGFAASARRRGDRAPRDLFDIGASSMAFLRKHAPEDRHAAALERLRSTERRRALTHMVSGALEPRDVRRLMRSLEEGIIEGARRRIGETPPLADEARPFLAMPLAGPRPGRVMAGWPWQRRQLHRAARAAVRRGAVVTVFCFGPTTLFHRMRFHPAGFWEQSGGLFGRAERDGPLLRAAGMGTRLAEEMRRIAPLRPVDSMVS